MQPRILYVTQEDEQITMSNHIPTAAEGREANRREHAPSLESILASLDARDAKTVALYQDYKNRRIPESQLDEFFDNNRSVLQAAGIQHYPTLSAQEQQILDGWNDLIARGERGKEKQKYFDAHYDVLMRRCFKENGNQL